LLDNDAELSSAQQRALRHVENGGRELLKLIDNILSVTRIESGQQFLEPTEFDIGDLVRQVEATFHVRCEHKGLLWRSEIALEETRVRGDGRKLQQALVHLLDNAVKFTAAGEIHLHVSSRDDLYSFEVVDTGPGIPAARRAAVFELFSQGEEDLEKGGSGLGLAIARSHVELMGGALSLEDSEGGGIKAAFAVPLPKAQKWSKRSGTPLRARPRTLAAGSALRARLVGRSDNLEIMAQILERIGGKVAQVDELATDSPAESSEDWDVVIVDIDDYNLDAIRVGRSKDSTRPKLIGLSASSLLSRRYLDAGFDRCIEVPLRPGRVYTEFAELLGIDYEYDTIETPVPVFSADFDLELPADLRDRLSKAAATHSITELKRFIGELKAMGPEEQRLADHLSALGRSFDMAAISAILGEIHSN
jgi:anti-sigma regulatory factor (Ser/Thr protein kinase)